MAGNKRYLMLKTGFIISLVLFIGSAILFTQNPPGSTGRTAMILVGITALVTSLSFLLQLRAKRS